MLLTREQWRVEAKGRGGREFVSTITALTFKIQVRYAGVGTVKRGSA